MNGDAQAYAALVSSSLAAQCAPPSESGASKEASKTRKPYTITKQRERWSEEEHLRFIEALRLHGRAWRKIEEHIGTKTAVQIRSHAQKFFTKLERKKEAGEAPDKEENFTIPPPRPKRKPAKPYPRKDGLSSSGFTGASQFSSQLTAQQQLAPSTQHMALNRLIHANSSEVTDQTIAAVTAAASAAAAAAAAAVVAAAGQEIQTHMQEHPPSCFPFFGMPPSVLTHIMPSGLEQAALAQHTAKAAMRFGGLEEDGAAAAVLPGVSPPPPDVGVLGDNNDRCLEEATGTTDGTHISAHAQLRGSDGDSACSRETDNQDTCPSLPMDIWQSKLQHDMGSGPSAAAARSLAALQAGGFDPSVLQWGSCFEESRGGASAALQGLQGFNPAQALVLLSNPQYMAADRQYQHAALQAAGLTGVPAGAAAAARSSSGGAGAATSMRTKSRRTAPSVNSGSTGNPCGTKRMLDVGSEQECMLPAKKAARELSDAGEEGEGMEVSPSSPSIQEKELKAASLEPSNTNGNTSGSNESDGSKRRQGTTQGEGSNPTNGNSSGNGYSMKDSNTGTNNGTNGTSAFNPVGHHHHHHHSHQLCSASRRTNNYSSSQQQGDSVAARHMHYSSRTAAHNAAGEGSNGGNDASGIGLSTRDEGRSSSDVEAPPQQLQEQHQQLQEVDDEAMEEPEEGGEEEEEQQQDNKQASHMQALMASLHGMCGNPMMLQQAYGAAAAAAATAQQIVANAMHSQHPLHHELPGTAQSHLAALQHMRQTNSRVTNSLASAPVSQGFAPWHSSAAAEFGSSGSFIGTSLLHHLAGGNRHVGASAEAQQLQLQAAAGLVGLANNWGSSNAASGGVSGGGSDTHLTAAAAHQKRHPHHQAQRQTQHPNHYHHHHHHHHHQHQAAVQQHMSGLLPSMSGGAGAAGSAAAATAGLRQLQKGLGLNSSPGRTNGASRSHAALALGAAAGRSSYSGLEALTRVASAVTLAGSEDTAAGGGQGHKRALSTQLSVAAAAACAVEEGLRDAGKRQSNTL